MGKVNLLKLKPINYYDNESVSGYVIEGVKFVFETYSEALAWQSGCY